MRTFGHSLVLFLVLALGCSSKKEGDRKEGDPKRTSGKETDPPRKTTPGRNTDEKATTDGNTEVGRLPAGPAITVSSKRYRELFDEDSTKATKQFVGKLIEMTGPALKPSQYSDDPAPTFALEGVPGKTDNVIIRLKDPKEWSKAMPGQTVKVRGTPSKSLPASNLELCEVLEARGGPTPVTPEAIATDYAGDPKAQDKYRGKPLVLVGEVAAIDEGKDRRDPIRATMKSGKPGPPVLCNIDTPLRSQLVGKLKPGQKIKVWALEAYGDKDKVQLLGAILYEVME